MGIYHPYWNYAGGQKYKNPAFDTYSDQILNLKHRYPAAIQYFYRLLEPLANMEVALAVVPPHDPDNNGSGIHDLAKLMCQNGLWIDATDCLQRVTKVPKLACGGSRSFMVHKKSIAVVDSHLIKGREILLLDDVKTTGNTFIACKMLLTETGAKSVQTYALGETPLNHPKR